MSVIITLLIHNRFDFDNNQSQIHFNHCTTNINREISRIASFESCDFEETDGVNHSMFNTRYSSI